MKVYLLWCFDGSEVELLGVYMDENKAYADCDELTREAQADELYWFSYSVSSAKVIQ